MKWKLISLLSVLLLTLTACMGDNNTQQGTDNPNIDQTTFPNGNTGDGFITDRDYMLDRDADRNQNRMGRDNRMSNNRNNNNHYDLAEEAADEITNQIKEIDQAYVLTTGNNAYVAASFDNDDDRNRNRDRDRTGNNMVNNQTGNNNQGDDQLADDVKQKISEIVKSVDSDIENVYVSTNPDFMDLANNYADDVENGEPIEGFFNQFGNMIDRLFPDNVQNGNNGNNGNTGNNRNNGNR